MALGNHPHAGRPVLRSGPSAKEARLVAIMLHGRGASAEDILELADQFSARDVAYLAPQAEGATWYPFSFLAPLQQNEPWLGSALRLVAGLVEDFGEQGVPTERLAVMGFSQGACLTLEFAARRRRCAAGRRRGTNEADIVRRITAGMSWEREDGSCGCTNLQERLSQNYLTYKVLTGYPYDVVARTAAKPKSGASARDTVVALLRAADRVRRRAARIVEPHGITLQQYNVLRILENAKEDGVPTLEVAARMIEETPGVTRLLDRLEAKAYIRRQRCPRDRRQHLCWLSSEGAGLLERLTSAMSAGHERVLQHLDIGDRQRLITLLDVIGSEE